MRRLFADSVYWIALASRKDQWHQKAYELDHSLEGVQIVTTQEILTEFLTHFCEHGHYMRRSVLAFVESISADPGIVVRPQSDRSFSSGLNLYKSRPDKEYSLTDCISMETMREEGIIEVLTRDSHFTQEGFTVLI